MGRKAEAEGWQAIGMSQAGLKSTEIGTSLEIPARIVRDILAGFRDNPNSVLNRARSGRPRLSAARQNRMVMLNARRNRFQWYSVLRCQ